MSIVLDDPELEAGAAVLAMGRGTDVGQIAAEALEMYLHTNGIVSPAASRVFLAGQAQSQAGKADAAGAMHDGRFSRLMTFGPAPADKGSPAWYERIRQIQARVAEDLDPNSTFTTDDLYDDYGLPK